MGSARDGVRAFFLEMQVDGKRAAQTVYQALNSAFDGIAANFAKLATGGRTAWKQLFQGIAEDIIKDQTRGQL
jgi:lambda family phage tail tape measure protein